MIRALLFDLDNTLIPEADGWNAAFEAAVAPISAERGFDTLALRDAVFGAAAELWASSSHAGFCHELGLGSPSSLSTFCPGEDRRYQGLREWLPSFRYRAWDTGLRAATGIRDYDLVDRLSTRYMAERMHHHNPYPGVEALLAGIAGNYRLAVITNGFMDLQRQKLTSSGLDHYFDATLISGDLGFGKPDRRIFETALSRLGVRAEEALVIGDSAERDIAGAIDAGIRAAWPCRDEDDTTVPADVSRLASLEELPALLRAL